MYTSIKRTITGAILIILSIGLIIQCQHDDTEVIPIEGPDPITHGNETLTCTGCTPENFNTGAVPVGVWYFDKAHSNVTWETPYISAGSLLTGRFNYFYLTSFTFDEAKPETIAFEAGVRLNSVNTGEPGRDAGCLLGTYGTEAAKTTEVENNAKLVSIPGTGRYSNTDAGFFVDANLTFHGFEKKVVVKLFYYPQSEQSTYKMAGVSAEFEILSKTDFGIVSTNIADKVKVKINANLKNKK